jgi:N-methylhydantoinase A
LGAVGIDIGGTFTDLVYLDEATSSVVVDKVPSQPESLQDGVRAGLISLCDRYAIQIAQINTVVHGTTVATNAVLEGKLPATMLLVTAGFGDILEIGTMLRPGLYDLRSAKPKPFVGRDDVVEISERIDGRGRIVRPLTQETISAALAAIESRKPVAVAICLLNSFLNPAHERELLAAVQTSFPSVAVSASFDVDPQPREFPRANTTILNASLKPLLAAYIERIDDVLRGFEGERSLFVMQSNGGLIPPSLVCNNAHKLVLSGPAGGVVAARALLPDESNLITLDVGGTSSDLCLIVNGRPSLRLQPSALDLQPVRAASLGIHTVGAGGGSIATVDREGLLSVGPRSAGAIPGPVCYRRGGKEPTVTDAQLVLGRLPQDGLLDGEMRLDRDAAAAAILEKIAKPLAITLEEAAAAMVDVAVATMERGLRVVSVHAGYDPRDFVLVAYGGGGPLNGVELAVAVGISKVIVPPASSAFSALGLLCADLTREYSKPLSMMLAEADGAEILRGLAEMNEEACPFLAEAADGRASLFADMRYFGQNGVLRIGIPAALAPRDIVAYLRDEFISAHRREFGHASADDPIEVATLKMEAARTRAGGPMSIRRPNTRGNGARIRHRPIYFAATGWTDCPVLDRNAINPGREIRGPGVIEDRESTTVVPPGAIVWSDPMGSLIMDVTGC